MSSADYGLPDASPLIPEGCNIVQMQLLYRHGARYPTSGAAPSTFAQKLVVSFVSLLIIIHSAESISLQRVSSPGCVRDLDTAFLALHICIYILL